jgi:RNA polymerase sigma-70 factor (ECF subfamily)
MPEHDENRRAWEPLVLDHGDFVVRYIAHLTRGRGVGVHSVEDITNEVWLRVGRSYPQPPTYDPSELRALLSRCVFNLVADLRKSHQVRARGSASHDADGAADAFDAVAGGRSAADLAGASERQAIVTAALVRLSADEQDLLRMRYFDRLSYVEMGRRLKVSDDCARKRCDAAFVRLERAVRMRLAPEDLSSTPACVDDA